MGSNYKYVEKIYLQNNLIKEIFLPIKKIIYAKKSPFQEIVIAELNYFGRSLILDAIQFTERDERAYHDPLVFPAIELLGEKGRKKIDALILGGGDGLALRNLIESERLEKAVLVDIDEEVVKASKKYFSQLNKNSLESKKLELIIDDAFNFLKKREKRFDIIISDLIDPSEALLNNPKTKIYSEEFFNLVNENLKEDGIFVTHAESLDFGYGKYFASYLKNKFNHVYLYANYVPSFSVNWSFILCSEGIDIKKEIQNILKGAIRQFLFPYLSLQKEVTKKKLKKLKGMKAKCFIEPPVF